MKPTLLEKGEKILRQGYVCNHCLGRQFAQLLTGYENKERGKIIRDFLALSLESNKDLKMDLSNFESYDLRFVDFKKSKKRKKCVVCDNLFEEIDKYVKKASKKLKKLGFNNFLVGTKVNKKLVAQEEGLWERVGINWCEPIKSELNRLIGKRLEKKFKKPVEFKKPEILVLVNLEKEKIEVNINSLYLYGEYNKLVRNIPQTKWPSGKYKTSIEEIIAKPLMKQVGGSDHKFHGCVSGETMINLNKCSLPIEELENSWKSHKIITFNESDKKFNVSPLKDFIKLDTKKLKMKTFEIETEETGRKLTATADHPLFTPKGMVPLSKLKKGDKIAVYPILPSKFEDFEEKTIATEKDILKTVKKYVPTTYKSKIKELKQKNLLPLKIMNKNIFIVTRLLAFLFGDGNIRFSGGRDTFIEFYGKKKDLERIKSDIRKLGFDNACSIRKRKSHSEVSGFFGKKRIISGTGCSMSVYSKPLWLLLVSLGAPLGDKVTNKMNIPRWIKECPKRIKKEFLASLFGAELSKPRLDKRKYNRKSFNTPIFSINKSEKLIENGIKFVNDIKNMLKGFGIQTLKIRKIPYSTRKDGNKAYKIRLDFSNKFENLIKLYGKIGFRYCKERKTLASYVYEYLLMKKNVVNMRKKKYKEALKLKKKGLKLMEIYDKIGNEYLSYKNISLWISPASEKRKFNNIKAPNNFPSFENWLKNANKNLDNGLVWESIKSIREREIPYVFDITTKNNDHNFFANGFLVSNSGREDIDARCLGWRPFVIEILEPKKRKVNKKKLREAVKKTKKVKIKKLKAVDGNVVERIKSKNPDKTYKTVVKLKDEVKKKDLKRLSILEGKKIYQETPNKVLHRRADKLRKRVVKKIKWKKLGKKKIELEIKAEAGTYIKELVSGDKGRTYPSVSEILRTDAEVEELDVVEIEKKKEIPNT